jgi:hypothetical protein
MQDALICFECGSHLDLTKPYRYMEAQHEKGNSNTMPIYANEECIINFPNEPNWLIAIRVDSAKQ